MTLTMGPPPPRNPTTTVSGDASASTMAPPPPRNLSSTSTGEPSTSESSNTASMGPLPPETPSVSSPEPSEDDQGLISFQTDTNQSVPEPLKEHEELGSSQSDASEIVVAKKEDKRNINAVPYTIPEWSGPPCHHFFFEVLKQGAIIDQIDVNKKGAYMFGRVDLCDFVLDHPTISRYHAVIQYKRRGNAYLYDLGSTHGTFVNKKEVKKRVYVDLHVGDTIRFGLSTRLYLFQGPTDLMPPEGDVKKLKNATIRQQMQDMEASLLRARVEASRADGISWGMGEDAIEENEDEVDEITWQTYKGQLTEKQEKTREKVIKRLEKIAHMKKEIDAIRAKDIPQGGLTQGQQTQIARNDQRTAQIMEELESLEETLNESIRESLGARGGGLSRSKKKGAMDAEEETYSSDDDDFYDRTQKSSKQKSGENQQLETADSLLDRKDALTNEIQEKEKLLLNEEKPAETNEVNEAGDALDAYMSAVSSQLVLDKKENIHKEISSLQSELDRILYLLRIADPTGEAAKKKELEAQKPKETPSPETNKKFPPAEKKKKETQIISEKSENTKPVGSLDTPIVEKAIIEDLPVEPGEKQEGNASEKTVFTVTKPQWLGAVEEAKKQEIKKEETVDTQESDGFIDYKDRGKIQGIEEAAPGLIIRKRKKVETSNLSDEVKDSEEEAVASQFNAQDVVALLLRHSGGLKPVDEAPIKDEQQKKGKKKAKRVQGPHKPDDESDSMEWVPPPGQSGDGRTSLNDRFGY